MEVVKTHVSNPKVACESNINSFGEQVAANRGDSLRTAISKTWARGGVRAFYQGLIPWVSKVVLL
jgi:hypothetical protein